jgi:hypothetical protein
MFASIRKYKVRRGSAEELARRVQSSLVPLLRETQGFRGHYLLDGGRDVLITISIFDGARMKGLPRTRTQHTGSGTTSSSSRNVCLKLWWAMPLSPRPSKRARRDRRQATDPRLALLGQGTCGD